jgi:hypothetical protein
MQRFFLMLFCLCFLNQVQAIDLSQIKILSAEQLNYKDGDSILVGNVKVQLMNYIIEAPRAFIDADANGNPFQARFLDDVHLNSEKLHIDAPEMRIDLNQHLFKCYANDSTLITTTIDDDKQKQAKIMTWYQEYNYETGFARATNKTALFDANQDKADYKKDLKQIIFLYDQFEIDANTIELQLNQSKVAYALFIGDAVAVNDKQRTEAQEIYFFPDEDLIKAQNDVRIVYADKQDPAYVFADTVILEKQKNILSAFSNQNKANAQIFRANAFSQARQIILNLDKEQNPDNAILTGMAYSQVGDKALSGHELLFDIKNQNIKTLVKRPKTLLFN